LGNVEKKATASVRIKAYLTGGKNVLSAMCDFPLWWATLFRKQISLPHVLGPTTQ